jgi:hypothetical protein
MTHARPFWITTLQDLFNGIKNTSMQGVWTLAIKLWVFRSPRGLQVPTFASMSFILTLASKWRCDKGGAEAGCFDLMWTSNCGRWILNQLMTFFVESQWLTTWGHIVCISAIKFCCRVKWVRNPIMIEKNHFLMTLIIMSSITRSSWCAPHQIWIREQSLCITTSRRVTTPATRLVILWAPSDVKPRRRIVQSTQSIVKNLLTIVDIISPVSRSNIRSAHPCRLTMEW